MKLTQKLIGFLNRVFKKDPIAVLAFRLSYDGGMTWTVADGRLTTVVVGGSGAPLDIDLSGYTVATLSNYLATRPGYSIPVVTSDSALLGLSARALLDGSKDIAASNGDHLEAYTSVAWAWMDAAASELHVIGSAIAQAPRMMAVPTAEGEWLDELGSYYAVPRTDGEADAQYAARMIATIGRPLGNNVAMEAAINIVTGGLQADVTDAPAEPFTTPYAGTSYGLFDVVYSIALDGDDDLNVYIDRVRAVVESYRDAGTHLKSITASGALADTYDTNTQASDSGLAVDVGVFAEETVQLEGKRHNGKYRRDGSFLAEWGGTYSYDGTIVYGWNPGPLISFNNSGEELKLTITTAGVPAPEESI